MSSTIEIASAFIQGAPPGELQDVVNDIQSLTSNTDPSLVSKLKPAFQTYNEEQLVTTQLPGGSQSVLISKYNRLPDGRYYDTESNTSFAFDHITQKSSSPQSYTHPSPHSDLIPSLLKSLSAHAREHYPAPTSGVYPTTNAEAPAQVEPESGPDSSETATLALLVVSNKYSPSNFWNGRWRSTHLYTPSTGTLTGTISVTVHYYEDGNVSLTASKPIDITLPSPSSSAADIIKKIAQAEKAYQTELNTAFVKMNEEGFKGLRRQLPVTRQKVEWEKVGGYRLGSDLRGGGQR